MGLSGPFLLRLDRDGNLVWQKIFGGVNDFLLQAQETSDDGIMAVGSMEGGNLAWALKLDSDGSLRGCPVGAPSNATIIGTTAVVTDTTVASVNTHAVPTSTYVTVTTHSDVLVQDQCKIMTKTV